MTNMIFITTQFEGFHFYENAPKEVEFLKHVHRHLFKLKIWIEVFHNDREIEFFMFKNFIKLLMNISSYEGMSCEMISDSLYKDINYKYPNRDIWIEVSEDGENGSFKQYSK